MIVLCLTQLTTSALVASITVLGALQASAELKKALADRIT